MITYDGYKCWQETEYEEDNYKEFHFIISPDGERHFLHHNPYEDMRLMDFVKYCEFHKKWGYMPERRMVERKDGTFFSCNWDNDSLDLLALEIRG